MATLDDLTQSLQEQNQKTDEYRKSLDTLVSELTNNFGAFLNESSKDRLAQIEAQREAAAAAKRASGIRIGSGDKTIGSQNNFGGMFAGLGIGKLGVGIGAAGAGIGAFFAGLAGAEVIMNKFGSGDNLKNLMKNLAEGIGYFGTDELLKVGALLAGSALFVAMPGLGGMDIIVGMGAVGLGIGGFFAGLGVGDAALKWMNVDGSKLAGQMKYLAEGLSAFSDRNLAVLGSMLGAGGMLALFSKGPGGTAIAGLKVVTGLTMIGAGIGGFFAGLGVADAAANFLDYDGSKLASQMKFLAEGLDALDVNQLKGLGALLGVSGGLFAVAPGISGQIAGLKVATGLTLVGLSIGGFFAGIVAALGVTSKGLDLIGADGSGIKNLITNMVAGLKELAPLGDMKLKEIGSGLSSIGGGLAAFFGGNFLGTISEDARNGWNWIKENLFGFEAGKSPIQKMVDSLKPLQDLDPNALSNLSGVSSSLSQFTDTLERISSINMNDFGKSMTNIASGVMAAVHVLPKMATGGIAEIPHFNRNGDQIGVQKFDFGTEGSGGLLNLNAPIGEMTEAMNKLRELISPNQTTNNYYGSPTSGARFRPVVYNPAPQTGSVMDSLLREFNANQGRPTVIVSDSSSKTNAPVTNNQQTVMPPATPTNDRKAAALGEWSPSF